MKTLSVMTFKSRFNNEWILGRLRELATLMTDPLVILELKEDIDTQTTKHEYIGWFKKKKEYVTTDTTVTYSVVVNDPTPEQVKEWNMIIKTFVRGYKAGMHPHMSSLYYG